MFFLIEITNLKTIKAPFSIFLANTEKFSGHVPNIEDSNVH